MMKKIVVRTLLGRRGFVNGAAVLLGLLIPTAAFSGVVTNINIENWQGIEGGYDCGK